MQIGTSYQYDRAIGFMTDLSSQTAKLQSQIATGKRVLAPSDDPLASARIARLDKSTADTTQYASNVKLAQSLLSQSDAALGSVSTSLQRAKELAIQAANGTLNDSDRASISQELSAIVDDLVRLANTTDVRGTPLFGGAGTGPAYVRAADGTVSYAGEGEAPAMPIGEGTTIQATDSGARVFGGVDVNGSKTDIFAIVSNLAKALAPGGSPDPATLQQSLQTGLDALDKSDSQINAVRASVGARGTRLDMEGERLAQLSSDNDIERGNLEGADIQTSVADLQKTMLALQATQASFTRLSQLSLFNYLG